MPSESVQPSKVDDTIQNLIKSLLTDRPIAYHASLARALKSATAGILLSQLLYWAPRSQNAEGWFYKTQKEIEDETALTRHEQDSARVKLRDAGIIEEKLSGVPPRRHFRIRYDRLAELLTTYAPPSSDPALTADLQHADTPQFNLPESGKLNRRIPANQTAANRQNITETTTESTTETTTEKKYLPSSDISFSIRKGTPKKIEEGRTEEHEEPAAPAAVRGFASTGSLLAHRFEAPEPKQRSEPLRPAQPARRTSAPAKEPETPEKTVIRGYVQDLRRRFRDYASENSSVTRAYRLFEQARGDRPELDVGTFVGCLEHAASITAERDGEIRYLFRVVENLIWPDEPRARRDTRGYHTPHRRKGVGGPYVRVGSTYREREAP
jgi:hypothetical protein